MKFVSSTKLEDSHAADAIVLPFWKTKKEATSATALGEFKQAVQGPVETQDFTGKEGETLFLYPQIKKAKRLILLGLGDQEKISVERLRRAFTGLVKASRSKKMESLNIFVPKISSIPKEGIIRGVAEGLLLTNYTFDKLKSDLIKDDPTVLLEKITFLGIDQKDLAIAQKYVAIVEGVYLARDLVNGNADDITPQHLADVAQDLAKTLPHVKATIFDKKRIQKEKMGLLLAVNRGSFREPTFIILEYRGNPKSKENTVIIGKGITYDTGGLNLKPTGSMETMRTDMGGAGTAFGTLFAAAKLGMKVNITVVVPSTENSIGSASYKPGDVYKSYAGKTVEIGNTDAEGRLILADALAYTVKNLKPTRIIDFATLTGAMEIALGAETIGLMSNQDALADALIRAGYETYERVCRLPLHEEYREQLKSDIADIRNIGGRPAGAITAALFLKEFVGDIPWAHCDIAGTAYLTEPRRYNPKHATGVGVRLMLEFLQHLD